MRFAEMKTTTNFFLKNVVYMRIYNCEGSGEWQ